MRGIISPLHIIQLPDPVILGTEKSPSTVARMCLDIEGPVGAIFRTVVKVWLIWIMSKKSSNRYMWTQKAEIY